MFFIVILLLSFSKLSNATDTLVSFQSINDGMTLVSKDGSFELGFFSPGSSRNRYVGISYKNIPGRTLVWVANRSNPISDYSGLLMIDNTGNVVLVNKNDSIVWSSNSAKKAKSPIVELLGSGNLVLRDENDGDSGIYLWQSFDYPSDTLLPGMKLGVNLKTGIDRCLKSWKNWDDPSPGEFVWKIQAHANHESTMWIGSSKYFRTGSWSGAMTYNGTSQLGPDLVFDFNFVSNDDEVYYIYHLKSQSAISRLVMNQSNHGHYIYNKTCQSWNLYKYVPIDSCDMYGRCGGYGNCVNVGQSPLCQCLEGFKPKSPQQWNSKNWSQGCMCNKLLSCNNKDKFNQVNGLKLPDTTSTWVNKSKNLKECREKCLQDCSCTAYTNFDIEGGGSGCVIWFNDLNDIKKVPSGGKKL